MKSDEAYEVRHAFCQLCGPAKVKCSTLCYLRDGEWIGVEGNPEAGNNGGRHERTLCPKGYAAMQTVTASDRLRYPMRRVGAKGVGPEAFERITWDEALDLIAATLAEQKQRYGAKSFGILSPQYFPVLATFGRRFLNVHGSPNYLHSGICNSQRVFAHLATLGGPFHEQANSSMPKQMGKTQLLVVWGSNSEASMANQGDPQARLDALARGMQVIDIRPMREPLGCKSDIWVPVRPGTDCALAMAVLAYIIDNDLYDHDFAHNWCTGFDQLSESLHGCTPAWAGSICGLDPAQIEEISRLMATVKPMAIRIGNGVGDQSADGFWTVACIDLIVALTGNLGIPGGGGAPKPGKKPVAKLKPFDWLSDRLPSTPEDQANGWMPGASNLVAPETPRWFQAKRTQESGPTSSYFRGLMSVLTEDPYPLRAVFAQATNPLNATRDPKRVIQALEKLDFYVVMDTAWNTSCDYADLVLPARTGYESGDLIACRQSPAGTWIGLAQPVVQPVGESKSDAQFYLDLAVRMGYGDDFWHGDMDEYLRARLEGTGVALEELRAKGQVFLPRPPEEPPAEPASAPSGAAASEPAAATAKPDYAKLFEQLPEGKAQGFNLLIGGKPNNDDTGVLEPLPCYRGPAESIAGTPEVAADYPLVLSDVHADALSEHSYYSDLPLLREVEPYPWVRINPATAARYDIADGDWVRVESPRSWVLLRAQVFECIAPDVLMARRGWWQACRELGLGGYGYLDGGSDVNVLYDATPSLSFDRFTSAMSKQTLVRISKAEPPHADADIDRRDRRRGDVCKPVSTDDALANDAGFAFDPDRCIGCWACALACRTANETPTAVPGRRWVVERDEGTFPQANRSFYTLSCRHCAEPECLDACPMQALSKREDGVVALDADACIGCGACVDVCAYDVPRIVDGVMDKCDGCTACGRTPEGLPRCVAACPTHALTFAR